MNETKQKSGDDAQSDAHGGDSRGQKVSIKHGTPGGSDGVPGPNELDAGPQHIAEKGDAVEQDAPERKKPE